MPLTLISGVSLWFYLFLPQVDGDIITVSLETVLGNISSLHGLHYDATRLYQPSPLFFCLVENGRFKHSFTESLSRLQKQVKNFRDAIMLSKSLQMTALKCLRLVPLIK